MAAHVEAIRFHYTGKLWQARGTAVRTRHWWLQRIAVLGFLTVPGTPVWTGAPAWAGTAGSDEPRAGPARPAVTYAQSWLGGVDTDRSWSLRDEQAGEDFEGDVGTLPLLGGAGSRLWGERVRFGFEGGGLVSWKSRSLRFSSIGGGLRIEVENELLAFEVFGGGVLSVSPVPRLRLYVAAGPALAWARLRNDDDTAEAQPATSGSGIVIDLNSREDDFSAALYGRAGVEVEVGNGIALGVSARYVDHEFDFGSSGRLQLDQVQWFLTVGAEL